MNRTSRVNFIILEILSDRKPRRGECSLSSCPLTFNVTRCPFSCQPEPRRRIVPWHVQLHELKDSSVSKNKLSEVGGKSYLERLSVRKFFILQQAKQLLLGMNLMGSVLVGLSTEGGNEVIELPRLNVVVCCIPAVNISLNGVTLVAYHETSSSNQQRGPNRQLDQNLDNRICETYIIGVNPFRMMVLSSWTVS